MSIPSLPCSRSVGHKKTPVDEAYRGHVLSVRLFYFEPSEILLIRQVTGLLLSVRFMVTSLTPFAALPFVTDWPYTERAAPNRGHTSPVEALLNEMTVGNKYFIDKRFI
jgi:hypothetical protein